MKKHSTTDGDWHSAQPLDVVILCGGLGTRLQPVVSDRPKPMADIEGRPFLDLLVTYVSGVGLRRFVLCAGYKADAVVRYFREKSWENEVELSCEPAPMGTGGALWHARKRIRSDPFLVLNGDSFCAVDLPSMIDSHGSHGGLATMAVVPASRAEEYGQVIVERGNRIVAFREKTPRNEPCGSPQDRIPDGGKAAPAGRAGDRRSAGEAATINAGIYVMSQPLLQRLGVTSPLSLEREVFPLLAKERQLYAFPVTGPLLDIGTPERYQCARQQLVQRMFHSARPREGIGQA